MPPRLKNIEDYFQDIITSLTLLPPGRFIKIGITDQGGGIPENLRQKIFDPYFSTKSLGNQKGMGLGLTIALSVLKQHDGYLTINSLESGSTQVSVYLPAVV